MYGIIQETPAIGVHLTNKLKSHIDFKYVPFEITNIVLESSELSKGLEKLVVTTQWLIHITVIRTKHVVPIKIQNILANPSEFLDAKKISNVLYEAFESQFVVPYIIKLLDKIKIPTHTGDPRFRGEWKNYDLSPAVEKITIKFDLNLD